MKIWISFVVLSLVFLTSCNIKSDGMNLFFDQKEGKEAVAEREYKLNFDAIKVSQGIDAEVIKSDVERVVISAPADILDDVLVNQSGDGIHIRFRPKFNISSRNVSAKIFVKDFHSISAGSSADIKIRDQFTQEVMNVDVGSSGSIEGDLQANEMTMQASSSGDFKGKIWAINLNAKASSSGDINISGKAKNAVMQASSSGSIDGKELLVEVADLQASSSGDIDLAVSHQLSAAAGSSGSIKVYKKGNLTMVSKSESSSGSVSVN